MSLKLKLVEINQDEKTLRVKINDFFNPENF